MPAKFAAADLSQQAKAFEYVAGILRGREREDFKKILIASEPLQKEVHFWEEQMMLLPQPESLAPTKNIWPLIERQLGNVDESPQAGRSPALAFWRQWLNWLVPSVLSLAAVVCALLFLPMTPAVTSGYVAVLTDIKGNATLTAYTVGEQPRMQLQWQPVQIPDGKDMQLWAISRRDGQPRSLAVFAGTTSEDVVLNDAQFRLVKDAQYLLLTEEEDGGSAVDEPSALILAKGICVRLAREKSS